MCCESGLIRVYVMNSYDTYVFTFMCVYKYVLFKYGIKFSYLLLFHVYIKPFQ